MVKDNMDAISITPGQKVQAEHFRLGDGGIEANVQNEFDYRAENLFTPQVIDKPISADSVWGLSGWTPLDSLEITTAAGDIICDKGLAYIGGRRYIRTGSGSIKSELGDPADAEYFIRIKYVVSTDTHSFVAEAAESAATNDNKYITLAKATWTDPNWTAEVDLRATNTSLQPPVTFSGDTDGPAVAVLTVTQTGAVEPSFEALGGDVVFFTSGSPFKHVIYGNDTTALRLYSGATNFGELRASSTLANTLVATNDFVVSNDLTVTGQSNLGTVVVNGAAISAATSIGSLGTITLANTGTSMTLLNAADQVIALTNSGAGNLNMTIDGKITVSATGSSIAGSATIGGVVLNANDVTADALNLKDATNQIVLDSDGTWKGTITMETLGANASWKFPNVGGTVAVSGTAPISVSSTTGAISHSTAAGSVHVPTAGATTQILQWSSAGTAKWITVSGDVSIADNGSVTVDGTKHTHDTDTISGLNMDNDVSAGTLAVAYGGTNISSYTTGDILYASAAGVLSGLTKGASNAVLMGGSSIPTWDATPSVSTITATATGSSIASSASVGGVTLNGGAITASSLGLGTGTITCGAITSSSGNFTINGTAAGLILGGGGSGTPASGKIGLYESSDKLAIRTSASYEFGIQPQTSGVFLSIVGSAEVIKPDVDRIINFGIDGAAWNDIYCDNLYYKTGHAAYDHLDDVAIIESIYPKKGTNAKDREHLAEADTSGLPDEIITGSGFISMGDMNMLFAGAIKQLSSKINDQDELIGVLMDQLEEIKKSNAS